MLRHRQIEAFRAVMVARTFTAAAGLLRISQPSVSRLISDMEASLPFALFERTHGRVKPTPEAIRLFEEIERSYESLERVFALARELGAFREAQLTIAAMPALCLDILPRAVAGFHDTHPDAPVMVHARSSRQVLDWVTADQCELGIATPPLEVSGAQLEMLVSAPAVCAMPVGHPLADREVVTLHDLRGERLIALSDSALNHQLDTMLQAEGLLTAPLIKTPLSIVACRMVELGLGLSVIDPFTAEYCRDRPVVIRPFRPEARFVFGVVTPMVRLRSRSVVQMLALLEEVLQAFPHPLQIERMS